MGLDMYLSKGKRIPKKSVSEMIKIDDLISNEENKEIEELYKDYLQDCGECIHWKSLLKEVVYWRKANAIHKWFVDNVQGGVDDCKYYEVTKEHLEELRTKCTEVLLVADIKYGKVSCGYSFKKVGNEFVKEEHLEDGYIIENAEEVAKILPTSDGFFFGSTEYNQWYYEDIKRTIAEINKVLKETDFEKEYLVYRASW